MDIKDLKSATFEDYRTALTSALRHTCTKVISEVRINQVINNGSLARPAVRIFFLERDRDVALRMLSEVPFEPHNAGTVSLRRFLLALALGLRRRELHAFLIQIECFESGIRRLELVVTRAGFSGEESGFFSAFYSRYGT